MTGPSIDVVPPEQAPDGITLLTEDHRKVEQLFQRLEALQPQAAAGDGDGTLLEERKSLADKVVIALSRHAVAEEEYLYPLVSRVVPGGGQLAEESIREHQGAKDELNAIDGMSPDHVDWWRHVQALMADIRHHVQEEEGELFPRLRTQVGQADLDELGRTLAAAEAKAPTHPHPHAPNRPPWDKLAAPGAALVDKARDAVSGRGKA